MQTVLSLRKHLRFCLNTSGKLEVIGSSPPPSQEGPLLCRSWWRRPAEDFPQGAPLPWRFPMGWDWSALCVHILNIFLVDRLTVVYISGSGLSLLGRRRLSCAKKARVSC